MSGGIVVGDSPAKSKFTADEIVSFLQKGGEYRAAIHVAAAFGASQKKIDEVLDPYQAKFGHCPDLSRIYGHLASTKIKEDILLSMIQRGLIDHAEEFIPRLGRELTRSEALSLVKYFCTEQSKGWKTTYTHIQVVAFVEKNLCAEDVQGVLKEMRASVLKEIALIPIGKPWRWGMHILDETP